MMGVISEALIRRSPDRISDTAPGRTPIAVARPPLVLPGFSSPLSIIVMSSMATSFPNYGNYSNSDYQKYSLTLFSEYQKLGDAVRRPRSERRETSGEGGANEEKLGKRVFERMAGICGEGDVFFEKNKADNRKVQARLSPPPPHRPRQANGDGWPGPRQEWAQGFAQALPGGAASP